MPDALKRTVALCVEYPMALRNGVTVLVEELIRGLADRYRIVLVSADDEASFAAHRDARLVWRHLRWDPQAVSPRTARALAADLARAGVEIAHFHLGANYAWGNNRLGHCPIPYLSSLGVRAFTTVHFVMSFLHRVVIPWGPRWKQIAYLPEAYAQKINVLRHVEAEIAGSRWDHAILRRWYWPMRHKLTLLYHSRLDEAEPAKAAPREDVILSVGHVAFRKGQHFLAEAFARLAPEFPTYRLRFAGYCSERGCWNRVEQIARERGLVDRIELLGSRDDAVDLMRTASVFVLPSTHEVLPLALQEALYNGCPSLSARAGGVREIIEHEVNGLLVPVGDVDAMTGALRRLLSDPALRRRLGDAGRSSLLARGLTAQRMIARYEALYGPPQPAARHFQYSVARPIAVNGQPGE